MQSEQNSERTDDLRYERNRFVAFAFASADAFLETDGSLRILYAAGAPAQLLGHSDTELVGNLFTEGVVPRDQPRLRAMASLARSSGRAGPIALSPMADHVSAVFDVSVTYLPSRGGRLYFTLKSHDQQALSAQDAPKGSEVGGLLNADEFGALASGLVGQPDDGAPKCAMTLLEITGLGDLESRLDANEAQELMEDIAAYLQIQSAEGVAARLSGDRYGVVHTSDMNVAGLEKSLADRAKVADPSGKGVSVGSQQLELSAEDLTQADLAKAVIYTITQFSQSNCDLTVADLASSYRSMLDDTRDRITDFKRVIMNQQFDVAFQPIVDLTDRTIHHHEALVRIKGAQGSVSPFQTIVFAEDAGVIQDFDMAMCRRIVWDLEQARDPALKIAVNLSGRSLQTPAFVDDLLALLKTKSNLRKSLMFEITESARIDDLEGTNAVVQRLRELGHCISLDDFGSGSTAYHYLRELRVDCVKIDGIYVQEAMRSDRGKAFLRSIVTLCSDLKIDTVGEMIENEETAAYLIQLGVRHGQGYLFGRPETGLPQRNAERKSVA